MMETIKNRFFVSVFVDGKNVNSYYSENLDDLITIKALHKDCEIDIMDLLTCKRFSKELVDEEVRLSGLRWKKSLERNSDQKIGKDVRPVLKRKKVKKYWERPVKCVETEQVFSSIRECSERLGLSHKSIWNAINSGNARNGLHFVIAQRIIPDNEY